MANKLTTGEKARLSVEAGLKSAETQIEDQCKQLHMTEIELAIQRQLVLDLKAELHKVKDVARVAREASEVAKMASYECGVQETETRLAEEVARVCRNYYTKVWAEALNRAGVPVNSELRKAENIFFSEDIQEFPTMLPPPVADPLPHLEQLSTIQAPFS